MNAHGEIRSEKDMASTTRPESVAQTKSRARARVALLVAAASALACSSAALAQNEDKVKAGLALWRGSGCADCHGAFADGEKQRDESPTGANLSTTRLDAGALKLAISCGRPGTGMPAFDEAAGTARACSGQAGGDLYPAPRTLTSNEIDAVIAYLQARIVGHGRITKTECLAYYDDQPDWCEEYK
jgi:mono/diheme cytochrome c family protein